MHHWKRWIGTGYTNYDDNNPMLQSIYFYDKKTLSYPSCRYRVKQQQNVVQRAPPHYVRTWAEVEKLWIPRHLCLNLSTESPHNMRKHMSRLWFQKWIPASMTSKTKFTQTFLTRCFTLAGIKTWPWLGSSAADFRHTSRPWKPAKLHIDECRWISFNFWPYKFMYNAWSHSIFLCQAALPQWQ